MGVLDTNILVRLRLASCLGSRVRQSRSQDQSASDPAGRFSLSVDTRALFTAPARNVLLVRMNYWLNWQACSRRLVRSRR